MHEENCFITLTYDEQNNPDTLVKKHYQDFLKRLREYLSRSGQPTGVRYYLAGEYGDNFGRPHYHALLFGYNFPDRKFFTTQNGFKLDTSEILKKLWPMGYSLIGDVSFESAAYVARYIMKKVTGENAPHYYGDRLPEFNKMSLKPGIGADWFKAYGMQSCYPEDFIVIRGGVKCKPPRYYDKKLDLTNPDLLAKIKTVRQNHGKNSKHNTPERLRVRHAVKLKATETLRRKLK